MNTKTRVAFIGLGIMGRDLLSQMIKNPAAEVVALCDLDPLALDKASAVYPEAPVLYEDASDMLTEIRPDAVVVAVPQHLHALVTIGCLHAGSHVFCEKPMALSVDDCETMIATAQQEKRVLMIGQVLQYINQYRFLLERVRSGVYGKPVAMRNMRSQAPKWDETWGRPWRCRFDECGGLLPEVNVHEIDLMCRILGEPISVTATGMHSINQEVDYEDFMTLQIHFAEGGIGVLTSTCCDYLGKNCGEIFCEKATLYFDSLTSQILIADAEGTREVHNYSEIHPEWENALYREQREFIEACQGTGPVTIPGQEGMRALEIAQAAYVSLHEQRTVLLPLPRTSDVLQGSSSDSLLSDDM